VTLSVGAGARRGGATSSAATARRLTKKPIEEEKLIRVPRELDLTPYRDEKDFGLLQRLVRNEK
jgi:hypothetical protein